MTTRQLSIDRAKWLLGWMSDGELSFLAELASELPEKSTVIEIGSFCGRSARALADNSLTSCTIYCIDPWNYKVPMWDVYGNSMAPLVVDDTTADQFYLNLEDHIKTRKVRPIKSKWKDIHYDELIQGADLIFIDGDHTYNAVNHDIDKALQYLKPGGILAGHDYTNFDDVHRAVNEHFQKTDIEVRETIWCVRKF